MARSSVKVAVPDFMGSLKVGLVRGDVGAAVLSDLDRVVRPEIRPGAIQVVAPCRRCRGGWKPCTLFGWAGEWGDKLLVCVDIWNAFVQFRHPSTKQGRGGTWWACLLFVADRFVAGVFALRRRLRRRRWRRWWRRLRRTYFANKGAW